MDAWLAAYRDPFFTTFFFGTNLVSMGAFLLFAIPMTVLAALDPVWARRFRIQSRAPRAQLLLGPSVLAFFGNNALTALLLLAIWPILRMTGIHGGAAPAWYVMAAQVIFFVYLDDLLYYGLHRVMHQGWLWKKVHSVHHRITTPWAITGHYMHPLEYIATASLMLVGPALIGAHVLPLFLWATIRQWEAAEGHSGYAFPFGLTHLLPGSDGALHHDFHHAKIKGNYAGFLAYVDGLFGTYAKGYVEARALRRRAAGASK